MDSLSVARFLSIPSAFLVSGYSIAASQMAVPLVYEQPASVSAPFLRGVFVRGAAFVVPGAIISSSASAYLAYAIPEQRTTLATASILTLLPLAFTRLVMMKGIQRLIEISESAAEQQKGDQNGEVVQLLKAWVAQNWVRAMLAFSGGMLAFPIERRVSRY
ncbi:hypothetical protein LTR37_011997 [Vermiconidia calcicola]|uniref:Uncharacterized protein n=1 Tax=Vermiconidia calcicola TaxID=1690605 RepID=A0ACC3N0Q8_9PEZI|nr:hypothetical protein LTR37_011997 [Vermiconidia calcicola]